MKKKYLNYFIIILYGICLISFLLNTNCLFGSKVDWLSQHSVIPDYFRNLFYETKSLFSNFAFNIGAGQNIFNFSYYGLYSPIIIISFLFPFLNMTFYIIVASIILYLLIGILMYKFINNHFSSSLALFSAIVVLTLPPLTFHFHHHIMFVWYLPFLLLGFIGIDKYVTVKKSLLLIISIFLIIMTNYYFSVTSLLSLFIYGIYKLLEKNENWKNFFSKCFKLSIRFIIPTLLAAFILLPTLYTVVNSERISNEVIKFQDFFIPDLSRFMFGSFGLGISGLFIVALFGNIIWNKKRNNIFFNGCLLIIITIPYIMFILNGFIYIRGKILIPFIPLYIYSLITFFKLLQNENLNFRKLFIIISIYILIMSPFNFKNFLCCLEILLTTFLVFVFKNKRKLLGLYLLCTLLVASIANNFSENYVKVSLYKNLNNKNIINLLNKRNLGFYRTNNFEHSNLVSNKVYNSNYYSTTLYSSTYNKYYRTFYNDFGNNIVYRNNLIVAASNNDLFNTFMGVKYIIAKNYKSNLYKEIYKDGSYKLYYNDIAYPIMYVSSDLGNNDIYDKLTFPYNLDYMLNNSVVASGKDFYNNSNIIEYYSNNVKSRYIFNKNKNSKYIIELPETLRNKILYISFDMNDSNSCSKGDTSIAINDSINTLSCKDWRYHNQNYNFKFVIDAENKLKIEISKGSFDISNVKIYYSDSINIKHYEEVKNLNIDKAKSIITGNINMQKNGYLISSIPYDKGFKVYLDDEEVTTELVNKAFLGFKISKGIHKIKIIYRSPYFDLGITLSIIGLLSLFVLIILEKKK